MGYSMNGYRDLDAIVADLWGRGIQLGALTQEQLKTNIACLLHEMLAQVPDYAKPEQRAQEFYDACLGIVECAQMDERI